MQNDCEKIRQRAHEIWDREGRPDGRAEEHWQQAERELAMSEGGASAGIGSQAEVPAKAKKNGNGAVVSAGAKPVQPGPRKRRGAQAPSQG